MTIPDTNSLNEIFRFHPNSFSAFDGSPKSNSTSAGLKYFLSILTNILPVLSSIPFSLMPLPSHLILTPMTLKASLMKSQTNAPAHTHTRSHTCARTHTHTLTRTQPCTHAHAHTHARRRRARRRQRRRRVRRRGRGQRASQ